MHDHVYKIIELAGSSPDGIEKAISNAVAKAADSVRDMRWFEVREVRGHIDGAKVAHYQVVVRVGFTLEG